MRKIILALIISLILATTAKGTIHDIMASNNTSAGVTISWITDDTTTGEVHYSKYPDLSNPSTAYDTRGQVFVECTHYVEIASLDKESTYYFEVVSGSETDNNNGNHYTFKTMKEPFFPPGICLIYGFVYQEDGTTPAEGAIVHLWLTHGGVDSYPLSWLVSSNGSFVMNLKESRSASTYDLFSSINDGDPIHLEVVYCEGCADDRDLVFEGCSYDSGPMILIRDTDNDGIINADDNCPYTPNGPAEGTCICGGESCMSDDDCEYESCSMDQEDSDNDGLGDVCDKFLCHSYLCRYECCIVKRAAGREVDYNVCVGYTDQSACETANCYWNPQGLPAPGVCTVDICIADTDFNGRISGGGDTRALKEELARLDCPCNP